MNSDEQRYELNMRHAVWTALTILYETCWLNRSDESIWDMLLEPLWRSYMRHAGWTALTVLEHVARINQSIWGFNPAIHVRSCFQAHLNNRLFSIYLKVVFAKNKRGYRLNATTERFWMLLILLLSVASIRRKLLKTSHDE